MSQTAIRGRRKRNDAERAFALECLVLAGCVNTKSLRKAMRIARRLSRQENEGKR